MTYWFFSAEEERAELVKELEQFIARLLHMVEVDVAMDLTKQGKIIDQVHGKWHLLTGISVCNSYQYWVQWYQI